MMSEERAIEIPSVLARIKSPQDVAGLDEAELVLLAQELRALIIDAVSQTGGHLASSLGTVELTLALLRLFNPKYDKIIWDVGHQAYPYKILTERADRFYTLRQHKGISGFPKMCESPYDHFGVGHSSTSISAALGMAQARELQGGSGHVLAVIGDGALTAGMAYEALNHAGGLDKRLIVVLNDNQMAISPNVGALSYFMSRNLSSRLARRLKREVADFLQSVPGVGEDMLSIARRGKKSFKTFFTPGILFEALHFSYIGPVDGHNLADLHQALQVAMASEEPILLHVLTQKGKGYSPAEHDPANYHGVGRFNPATGNVREPKASDASQSYTQVFASALCDLAEQDDRIVGITAAMPDGTGLLDFAAKFPSRFYDVGICEQHAVTFAAGLATQGMKPVVAVYSTFLQRAYDQVIHDVALQNLPVVFALDRAGLVGEDGPTHHGVFDISYLRHMPNMHILAPRGRRTLQNALLTALALEKPVALRYPRGACPFFAEQKGYKVLPLGQGELLREGDSELAVIAVGGTVHRAWGALEEIQAESGAKVSLFDPVWLKPMPEEQILELAARHKTLLVIEEHALAGGFGSAVLEFLADKGALGRCRVVRHGIGDSYVEHGAAEKLRETLQLDQDGIKNVIKGLLTPNPKSGKHQ